MIRALTFFVVLAAIAAAQVPAPAAAAQVAALAANPPTLKRTASVTGDIVRIGDLVDNAGDDANTPIFRSPDVGTTGSVTVQQVLDALRPHHIYLVETGNVSQVEVTRTGRSIDISDIETRIAGVFAGRYGLGEAKNLSVTLDRPAQPVTIEASVTGDLALRTAALDPRFGRFDVSFDVPGSAATRRAPVRFTGTIVETVAAAVLTRALGRGEIIKAADLSIERRPKAEIVADMIGIADDAIGLAVRQPQRAGQPLRRADLTKPELVHRDDTVTLVYEVPGILLTTRGKAIDSGAEGDVIGVLNIQSKRTVQGIVSGPGRVTIMAATLRASADTTPGAGARAVASR
jgi:flagella basal body P-ring formation protein FlgA